MKLISKTLRKFAGKFKKKGYWPVFYFYLKWFTFKNFVYLLTKYSVS